VLWYYPVVGLFKIFGVNFVLMRAYFLAFGAPTLLAFLTSSALGDSRGSLCGNSLLPPGAGMIFKLSAAGRREHLFLLQVALTAGPARVISM
jgi:hypothetical protein